jgi:PAS domain S-box-containing protein
MENIVDVVCVFDRLGIIRYVSDASPRFWGYAPHEMTGRPFTDFIVPEDVAPTLKAIAENTAIAFTHHHENRYRRKNGSIVYVSWSARWNEAEQLLYCVGRDGSGQRALEQRLLKAQEIAGVANFEFDVINRRFDYISENIYAITGLSKTEIPQFTIDHLWSLLHPDDRGVLPEFCQTGSTVTHRQHQYRIIRPDGRLVYLHHNREMAYDAAGRHYYTIGTLQDVTQQKVSEQAVQQSEKKFRTLVQNCTDMVGILNTEGRYVYVGQSVEHLLGYNPSDVVGKSLADFIHPEDAQNLAELFQKALAQKHMEVKPVRFRNSKGEWRWVASSVTNLLDDPDIGGLVYNSRDITDQKVIDDRIRELSMIAQESMQAILITDKTHRITWVNKAFCSLSEYSPEDVLGKTPNEVFHRSFSEEETHKIRQTVTSGKIIQLETLCHSKHGNPYWVHLNIQPILDEKNELVRFVGFAKDITESKKAQQELAFSEQKFKALVQEGSDLIAILDLQGCFTYISDSIGKCLGYGPSEILGKNLADYVHPDDMAATKAGIDRVKTNEALNGVQHRLRHKNGHYVWLESKGIDHTANPLIGGIIVNARDITDRVELQKRLDAELYNKQREITSAVIKAQESERSKLGLELHDNVNQVLTTVKLYNEMYLSGYREDRSLLERSTQYLQECINEIRSISKRLSAPTLGKISLHDSVSDLVESVNLTNKLVVCFKQQAIEQLQISEDLHLSVYRIIQEGLNNIIKYAGASRAEIVLACRLNTLELTISDNGKGFNSKEKWLGIGITNMRTRAENMNGRFMLQTHPGKGCIIKVSFPLPAASSLLELQFAANN